MTSPDPSPLNCCGYCGATSYRRVLARDSKGVMRYAEPLLCSGCQREFADTTAWREGATGELPQPEAR